MMIELMVYNLFFYAFRGGTIRGRCMYLYRTVIIYIGKMFSRDTFLEHFDLIFGRKLMITTSQLNTISGTIYNISRRQLFYNTQILRDIEE